MRWEFCSNVTFAVFSIICVTIFITIESRVTDGLSASLSGIRLNEERSLLIVYIF